MACACDSVSPLPVEEKAIMGTWRVLAISFVPLPVEETTIMGTRRALAKRFSLCLTRKRQSWGACDSLFPLPVEEKDFRGTPQGSVVGVHMGLLSALKGSVGLRRAPLGSVVLRGAP